MRCRSLAVHMHRHCVIMVAPAMLVLISRGEFKVANLVVGAEKVGGGRRLPLT